MCFHMLRSKSQRMIRYGHVVIGVRKVVADRKKMHMWYSLPSCKATLDWSLISHFTYKHQLSCITATILFKILATCQDIQTCLHLKVTRKLGVYLPEESMLFPRWISNLIDAECRIYVSVNEYMSINKKSLVVFLTKRLSSEQLPTYCKLKPWEQISLKLE